MTIQVNEKKYKVEYCKMWAIPCKGCDLTSYCDDLFVSEVPQKLPCSDLQFNAFLKEVKQ